MVSPLGPKGLSIAGGLELLRLSMPEGRLSVGGWSDSDYALAGAHLIDLSFMGEVDTDIRTVTRSRPAKGKALPAALKLLDGLGGSAPLDVVLEEVVARIGDLRAAILASFHTGKVLRCRPEKIVWGFVQQAVEDREPRQAAQLRDALTSLIESDELPSPEEAALISVLHASGMIGQALGGASPAKWLSRHARRIDAIHRMDLVGQTVSGAIGRMRERLRAYVLGSEGALKGAGPRSGALWEWRTFWPAEEGIEIPAALGLIGRGDAGLEELNTDIYLFVHGKRDNIKFRGKGLKVKPVIEAFDEFCAFAPSRKVDFPTRAEALSGIFPRFNEVHAKLRTREDMLAALAATGYRPGVIEVSKVRRQYRAILGVKIELAQIHVNGRMFHSLSLESHYLTALRVLSRNVAVGHGIVGGYGEFLEHAAGGRG